MMMKSNFIRKDWLSLLLIFAGFGLGLYFYPVLPERVPSHWNLYGQVDGYSSRFFGAFGLPIINAVMYLVFIATPYLDPKRSNYKSFEGSYRMLRMVLHIFMTGLQLVILAVALGYPVNVAAMVKAGISVIFILIGNVMGRFRFNYFVGVKTPWTLANEEVWRKTHRIAAPVWVAGGTLCLATSFWNNGISTFVFFAAIIVMSLIPAVYSYVEYKKLEKV